MELHRKLLHHSFSLSFDEKQYPCTYIDGHRRARKPGFGISEGVKLKLQRLVRTFIYYFQMANDKDADHSTRMLWVHTCGTSIFYHMGLVAREVSFAVGLPADISGASFVDSFCYLCFMSVMLSCLFIAALWSPA